VNDVKAVLSPPSEWSETDEGQSHSPPVPSCLVAYACRFESPFFNGVQKIGVGDDHEVSPRAVLIA
jgi:hypothetical protein